MSGDGEIMAGRGWPWGVATKLWLVVGAGCEIMAGREWWLQNNGWSWVVVDGRTI